MNLDPELSGLARAERRRRRRMLFRQRKVPVRMLVPNFFTLLSLCAGLTAIRMAIDSRYDMAIALIVAAALLDAIDGRIARLLKSQSKFGAELDSLADFANFGIAPAIVIYSWGLIGLKGFGWITALVFALSMGLRLARFNASIDVEKPRWQSNYFTGVPAPAGAIIVLLPLYINGIGLIDLREFPQVVAVYTLAMAALLVATLPTFSGKLMGERIEREWVLPILVAVGFGIALLVQYPHETLAVGTLIYLALIPVSRRRFSRRMSRDMAEDDDADDIDSEGEGEGDSDGGDDADAVAGEDDKSDAAPMSAAAGAHIVDLRGKDAKG